MWSTPEAAPPSARLGWSALLAVSGMVLALTAIGRAGWLLYLFPPLCIGLGLILVRRPAAFIVFTLGVWVWAPFVRRIVDWQTEYHQLSSILATPTVLTGLAFLGVGAWRTGLARAPGFAMLGLPLAWALAVGFLNNGIVPAAYALLAWAGPALFGLYVLGAREREPGLEATVLGGLALLAFGASIYGIAQFVEPGMWDRRWMINSGMPVLGEPLPFRVRVFGPLNSPVPFAAVMVAGIIAAILDPRPWRWFLAPTMLVALLLSLVRSEWLALAIGMTAVALVAGVASIGRVVRMFAVVPLVFALGLPLLAYEPIQRAVVSRVESFRAGSSDVSLRDRLILYQTITFEEPILGKGLGSTDNATRLGSGNGRLDPKHGTVDSALIQLATSYGIPMAVAFLAVLAWLATAAVVAGRRSSAGLAGLAIVAASLSQLPSYNMLISAAAVLLYFGLGLSLPVRSSATTAAEEELEASTFPDEFAPGAGLRRT
ncbi:O-antigen ligase family protein [Phenylobacterium sp.]|uniref:O-antigen ligase family protein n=1 Tax=Phenylobacterium sp. TaxID=1871053 RepID=UPI0035AE470B